MKHNQMVSQQYRKRTDNLLYVLVLCSVVTACASDSKRIDYSAAKDVRQLEIPPDLTKLTPEESLVVPKVGDIKSSGATSKSAQSAANTKQAINAFAANITLEGDGQSRWLRITNPSADVWQKTLDFWQGQGFSLQIAQVEAGVIETEWGQHSGNPNQGGLRGALGKALSKLFDSGERVRYLTRIEKSANNNILIFIAYQGIEEVATDADKSQFRWVRQAANPQYEAKMLSLLAANLSGVTLSKPLNKESIESSEEQPLLNEVLVTKSDKAELLNPKDKPWQIAINNNFERSWLFTSLALDRGGFSVEEKDRSRGFIIVRYVDPLADQDKGFLQSIFRSDELKLKESRYRLELQNNDPKAAILTATSLQQGADNNSANRLLKIIFDHLK